MGVAGFRKFQVVGVSEGSPGAAAGIRIGDIIEEYDGARLACDVNGLLLAMERGLGRTEVSLILWRGGQSMALRIPGGKLGIQLVEVSAARPSNLRLDTHEGRIYLGLFGAAALAGVVAFFLPVIALRDVLMGSSLSFGASGLDACRLGLNLFSDYGRFMRNNDIFYVSLLFTPLVFFGTAVNFLRALTTGKAGSYLSGAVTAACVFLAGLYYAKGDLFSLAGAGFWIGELSLLFPSGLYALMVNSLANSSRSVAAAQVGPSSSAGAPPSSAWVQTGETDQRTAAPAGDLRPCPYCAEMIRKEAIRCRYCRADIEAVNEVAVRAEQERMASARAVRDAEEKARAEEAEKSRKEAEAAALEATRQMWSAGDRAGAREFLLPLLTREGIPPNGATALDYVRLALVQIDDMGPEAGLQILSRLPAEVAIEPTPEVAELVAVIGRDAILKVDDSTVERIHGFAIRSKLQQGPIVAALGTVMEARGATELLDRGYALETAEVAIGRAREMLKAVMPTDDQVFAAVETRIRLVEDRILRRRQATKRTLVRASVAGGAVLVVAIVLGWVFGRATPPARPTREPPAQAAPQATSASPVVRAELEPARQPPPAQTPRPNTPAVSAGSAVQTPCTRARAPELGEPLTAAIKLSDNRPVKAADTSFYQQAVAKAEEAATIDPQCPDVWSMLAYLRYRVAYDICGRGDYSSAEAAAAKALSLGPQPKIRAAVLRNQARIAAAKLKWEEAERLLNDSLSEDPTSHDARSWLDDLSVLRNPRPEFTAQVRKTLAGEMVAEAEIKTLSMGELANLLNAVLARYGRRLNAGAADWFFFCDGSPLANHPSVDPNAPRNPIKRGTQDSENEKLIIAVRRQAKAGGAQVPTDPSSVNPEEPSNAPVPVEKGVQKPQPAPEQTVAGIWIGEGRQASGSKWSIRLTLHPESAPGKRGADIEYPSLGCGGALIRRAAQGVALSFEEVLDHGLDKCVDHGFVTLTHDPRAETLQFEYRKGPGQDASAVLRRTKQVY